MTEAEEITVYEHPVRYVYVEFLGGEDGGGVKIIIRFDGEPPEKLVETFERIFKKVVENTSFKNDDRDVV